MHLKVLYGSLWQRENRNEILYLFVWCVADTSAAAAAWMRANFSLSLSVPLYHPSFVRLLCTVIDGWFLAGAYASARTRTQTHARIALHTHINIAVYCISIVSQCQRFPSFYLSRSMSYWNFAIPYASSAFVANALANVCAHMCVLCVFVYERTSGHWCNKREQR